MRNKAALHDEKRNEQATRLVTCLAENLESRSALPVSLSPSEYDFSSIRENFSS